MQGDYAGALRDLDEALKLKPKYGFALTCRGRTKQWQGDHAGALREKH